MSKIIEIRKKQGLLHNEYGPALVIEQSYTAGKAYFYYINGLLHNENGPAIEYPSGTKYYMRNGVLHREDGPAVIWYDGRVWFYLNGKETNSITINFNYTI
jgi:hypothetical protein